MRYPTLPTKQTSRQVIDVFGGYNHNLRIGEGEFYDMQNLSSNYYPVLAPREKRGWFRDMPTYGLMSKDGLCYITPPEFIIDGKAVDMGLSNDLKTLVPMGAYVIIFPDKKYINTQDLSWGDIEATYETNGETTFTLCNVDGVDYQDTVAGASAPEDTSKLWIDTSSTPHALKQYATTSNMWVTVATTYIKIAHQGIGSNFEYNDGVSISGITVEGLADLNNTMVIQAVNDDYIVVVGILDAVSKQTDVITVKRAMPEMDFVIEAGNRLWGCKYGMTSSGTVVNEIYASKLGDFKNWNCFMGVSTDSYVASVGSDGPFTGAITHLGYPLFFKENVLHKVYGNYPANYRIQDTPCRGVQSGSGKSLAIVNEVLYYKSRFAVCAYDGSLPTEISAALGDEMYSKAVAGVHRNKYYISMEDTNNKFHLFEYDTIKQMWHKVDDIRVAYFCSHLNELYYVDHIDGGAIKTMFGSGTKDIQPVKWFAETGIIGTDSPDRKYISKLNVRMSLEFGSVVYIFIQYDSSGSWEKIATIMDGDKLRSLTVPIKPRRCDHLRLRIEGEGHAKIFSIAKTISQGSDK